MSAWQQHVERWKDCTACPLCRQRYRICLARGDIPCDVLFIGEAPGQSEDATGLVFWGPAGDLLDNKSDVRPGIIQRALRDVPVCATCGSLRVREATDWSCLAGHTSRDGHGGRDVTYALTNLVCCFPAEAKARGENEPERDEILACRPRLNEFINIAQPRLIVCVGVLATEYIDHNDTVPCFDIIHPAAILRKDMPRVQKGEAVRRTAVKLRGAVDRILQTPRQPFREFGKNASLTQSRGLRQRFDAWERTNRDIEIPF